MITQFRAIYDGDEHQKFMDKLDARIKNHDKDIELYERLLGGGANGHWSPFEHVATPAPDAAQHSANFAGWEQYRKRFPEEHARTFPDAYAAAI